MHDTKLSLLYTFDINVNDNVHIAIYHTSVTPLLSHRKDPTSAEGVGLTYCNCDLDKVEFSQLTK